jgi:hypothetical protein
MTSQPVNSPRTNHQTCLSIISRAPGFGKEEGPTSWCFHPLAGPPRRSAFRRPALAFSRGTSTPTASPATFRQTLQRPRRLFSPFWTGRIAAGVTRPGSSAARGQPRSAPLPAGFLQSDARVFGPCPLPEAHAAGQVSTRPLLPTHAGVDPRRPRPCRRRVRVVSRDAGEASRLYASMSPSPGLLPHPRTPSPRPPHGSSVTRRLPRGIAAGSVVRDGREPGRRTATATPLTPTHRQASYPATPAAPAIDHAPMYTVTWPRMPKCVPLVVRDVSGFFGIRSSLHPIRRTT